MREAQTIPCQPVMTGGRGWKIDQVEVVPWIDPTVDPTWRTNEH
jgi:hypothetical protein